MKRNHLFLICAVLLTAMIFAGCSTRNETAKSLSADDMIGILGMDYERMKSSIGTQELDRDERRAVNYSYKRNILGTDTDFSLTMGQDDKVERIVIYTDKKLLEDWRSALGNKYGLSASDVWRDDDTQVRITDNGDRAVIFIEKAA